MANLVSQVKVRVGNLDNATLKLMNELLDRFEGGSAVDVNENDDNDENSVAVPTPKRRGRKPGSGKKAQAATAKRGAAASGKKAGAKANGKRTRAEPDVQLTSPKGKAKNAKAEKADKAKAAKTAKAGKASVDTSGKSKGTPTDGVNFGSMSKKEIRQTAEEWGLEGKGLRGDLVKTLTDIHKMCASAKISVDQVKAMAEKAGVETSFGRGRPPVDYMHKRRLLVAMANEKGWPIK